MIFKIFPLYLSFSPNALQCLSIFEMEDWAGKVLVLKVIPFLKLPFSPEYGCSKLRTFAVDILYTDRGSVCIFQSTPCPMAPS
jgi:hypothetical protein